MFSVQENRHITCQYILSQHADPNMVSIDGENTLHVAVYYSSHEALELLMPQIDFGCKTKIGETLFHYAAQYADVQTLQILNAYHLHGINPNDVITGLSPTYRIPNLKGLNGMQIAELRTDVKREWPAMFRTLMHKLEFPGTQPQAALQSESEEFHDALESQDC